MLPLSFMSSSFESAIRHSDSPHTGRSAKGLAS
jgi:hypothetical protein